MLKFCKQKNSFLIYLKNVRSIRMFAGIFTNLNGFLLLFFPFFISNKNQLNKHIFEIFLAISLIIFGLIAFSSLFIYIYFWKKNRKLRRQYDNDIIQEIREDFVFLDIGTIKRLILCFNWFLVCFLIYSIMNFSFSIYLVFFVFDKFKIVGITMFMILFCLFIYFAFLATVFIASSFKFDYSIIFDNLENDRKNFINVKKMNNL